MTFALSNISQLENFVLTDLQVKSKDYALFLLLLTHQSGQKTFGTRAC